MMFLVIICASLGPCGYLKLTYVLFKVSGACYSVLRTGEVLCSGEYCNQEMHGQCIHSHLFYIHHRRHLSASIHSLCQVERSQVKGEEMGNGS